MVNIYVRENYDSGGWIRALEIPAGDIARFSLRPLKWLRFVAFAVFGAKGDLCCTTGPDRNIVDYETTSINEEYYFFSDEPYHLVDSKGLDTRVTSSFATQRRSEFRTEVSERDENRCVITGTLADMCHAAHIIPHSKGDEYIHFVISDRGVLYEDFDEFAHDGVLVDSVVNGIFLDASYRHAFDKGRCVFLKTPNFALNPSDIPRVEAGDMPASRVTYQYLVPWKTTMDPQWDLRLDMSSENAPLSILLDFMYGTAVLERWHTPEIQNLFNSRHDASFSNIPGIPRATFGDGDDVGSPLDDSNNHDYKSSRPIHLVPARRPTRHRDKEPEICKAMDLHFKLNMFLRGYPPETTFSMIRQKQEEEARRRSCQASREKVEQWLETSE